MTGRALETYGTYTVGLYTDPDGVHRPHTIALPTGLPPARLAMALRAARWVDTGMMVWLLGLPVSAPNTMIALSEAGVIHRWTGAAYFCGNRPQDRDDLGTVMPLTEATAVILWPDGRRRQPKPCATCFATGLLVLNAPAGGVGR